MDISCAFPTTLDTPEHIAVAEELGYVRAWVYDTPQQSPDVWMTLALAASRTSTIGLGPGVLVPSLRHPMVNAAGTAALAAMAPGRVSVAFGTGFTGRRAMGYRAIPWSFMSSYIATYRSLLRGEIAEWEGAKMEMLHPYGHAAPRPVDVPVLVAALGPKGHDVARQLGDGVFAATVVSEESKDFDWVAFLCWGTVLDPGEDHRSPRVRAAAGPGWALAYHAGYELQGPAAVRDIPGGEAWLSVIDRRPVDERHLAIHQEHCVGLNEADQVAWDAGGSELVGDVTVTGTADDVRSKVRGLAGQGVTELVYQPAGADIRRELERFIGAVG